jgi:tetratricopeptide (TPR) repeat protein
MSLTIQRVIQSFALGVAVLCFGVGAVTAQPKPSSIEAKQRAAELDALFIELQSATSQSIADRIVVDIWKHWLKSGDATVDALVEQATMNMRIGNLASAVAILDQVVKQEPGFAEGWNKRATLRYMMGQHARSAEDCAKVLALEPRHFGALAGLGLIAIAKEDFAAALAAYRRALAVNPFLNERDTIIPALEKRAGEKRL